ncbi:hypothetical protein OpiT1DRAFT_03310 [Opitutaceae bacterium TAV1]|nr:hypothetical protein OpiT1DRAFT_03310 [Opitutaceae bacterium TAV1]
MRSACLAIAFLSASLASGATADGPPARDDIPPTEAPVPLRSEPAVDSSAPVAPDADATLAAKKARLAGTLAEGRRLMQAGDEAAAESRLQELNDSPRGTWDWHMESVASLLRVAHASRDAGDMPAARRAARRLLVHLSRAEALSEDDPEKLANIEELRGLVQERLVGTTGEAAESYRRAVRQADRARAARRAALPDSDSRRAEVRNDSADTASGDAAAQATPSDEGDAANSIGQTAALRLHLIEGFSSENAPDVEATEDAVVTPVP